MSSRGLTDREVRRRHLIATAGIAIVALVVGVLLGRLLAPGSGESGNGSGTDNDAVVPDNTAERTEAGAVKAATEFARLVSAPSGDGSYRQAVEELAFSEWRERADELATNTLEFLEDRYGTGGWWSFIPARYRVVEFSESAATVELWGVTIATGPKIQGVEETWITGSLDLSWTSNGWRISGEDSVAGPTPELLTSEDNRDASVLDGFSEYRDGPTP